MKVLPSLLLPIIVALSFVSALEGFGAASVQTSAKTGCGSYRFDKMSPRVMNSDLEEMSGLVLGGLDPDTLVHVQDSGNDPYLIYTKTDGTILARYLFTEKIADTEELSRGECPWGGSCIFVFDTGDNFHWRGSRTIWAVEEATVRSTTIRSQKFDFKFPNDEHLDVEAATLIGKTIYFFAKEPKHSRVFALETAVWRGEGSSEAKLITDLPYTMITGATSSDDGERILLINWQGVIELSKSEDKGSSKAGDAWFPYRRKTKIHGLAQQEAVTYDKDQRSFFYSSEKKMFSEKEWGIVHAQCIP